MEGRTTDVIKEKLDIAEFLKGYLALVPAGKNFKALCPFHHEKTPSFMISPERQSWHCFGCGLGGDVFAFLMKYENIEFAEALKVLAERAGVELRRTNPAEYKFAGILYDLNAVAKDFFRSQLGRSAQAQEYLRGRKLAETTIAEFEIGWAPPAQDALTLRCIEMGYRPDDIIRAGLAFKTDRGMMLDRFRGRIMFPIHNHLGKVVGFTGRILPEYDHGDSGKYVNSPETPVFQKSKLLYGFWKTKNAIRDADSAFLVEGQMDFLMSWQAGVTNVVASSGTALTTEHLRALRRLTDRLIVSFDSDSAGLEAGERAIDLAEANGFSVKIAALEGYKDPADAVAADPAALSRAIAGAVPASEFYFRRYLVPKTDERAFLKGVRAVLQKIQNLASPIERSLWLKELATRSGLDEAVLHEELQKTELKKTDVHKISEDAPAARRSLNRIELLSEGLVAAAFARNDFALAADHERYLTEDCKNALHLLQQGKQHSSDPVLDSLINLILLRADDFSDAEVADMKANLFKEYVVERRRTLSRAVKAAEASHDAHALAAALEEFKNLPVL